MSDQKKWIYLRPTIWAGNESERTVNKLKPEYKADPSLHGVGFATDPPEVHAAKDIVYGWEEYQQRQGPGTLEERMRRSLLEEAIAEAQVIEESQKP